MGYHILIDNMSQSAYEFESVKKLREFAKEKRMGRIHHNPYALGGDTFYTDGF